MTWSASTDNVGVTGYNVFLDNAKLTTVTGLNYSYTGLTCGKSYTVGLEAQDAAGNVSNRAAASGPFQTAACDQPPPPPPATGGLLELSGSVSESSLEQQISSAPSGALLVRPMPGTTATVMGGLDLSRPDVTLDHLVFTGTVDFNPGSDRSALTSSAAMGFNIFGADSIVIGPGNSFDGKGVDNQNILWDQPALNGPTGYRIVGNDFKNFYGPTTDIHSEALYVGGGASNGLIENNTFTNNGNTSHIFFTWFGTAATTSNYPKNVCVKGNTFNATHGAYFDVNLREEIPVSSGIAVDPDNNASITNAGFTRDC